jgi:hypothetical protein
MPDDPLPMTEQELVDAAIRDRIKQIFPTPEIASKVIDLALSKKPQGWSHKSNSPYYNERCALQIKKDIDTMILSGGAILYRYGLWCPKDGMSPNTLYTRVNQSIRYLIDKLDTPERTYLQWWQRVRVSRKHAVGDTLALKIYFSDVALDNMHAEISEPEVITPVWKQRLEDWLESPELTKPFVKEGLSLSPQEIAEIKASFSQVANVQVSVSHNYVRAIKINI